MTDCLPTARNTTTATRWRSSRGVAALLLIPTMLAGCSEEPAGPPPETRVDRQVTPAVRAVLPTRPDGPLPAGTSCSSGGCHAEFRSARFVHGVLHAAEPCSVCHQEDQGDHVFPVKRPGSAGCTFCHEETIGHRVYQHGATDVACLECHDAHASENVSLLRSPSVATICAGCHRPETPAVPHGPFAAGACVACHDPHESDFPGLLRGGEGPRHCRMCHEETVDAMATARFVHAPVTEQCQSCHDPHGSDHPHGLTDAVDQTCFSCHAEIEAMVAGASTPHGAVSLRDQCANCHDAHASDRPLLLKDRQDVLCLQCHDQPVTARDGRVIPDMTPSIRDRAFKHGPVESGQCTACHNVHGARQTRLLREQFEPSFYASFDLTNYALCFECHESALVTEPRTATLTDFRDGERNLHFLHVNREKKGRTCRTCHEIHGSDLPSHIAESVPFEGSSWALPIGFEPTATGGGCAPGCHVPMQYDRVEPINPGVVAPGASP
ncbi:MAG: hypothetical protein HKO59_12440 [Phycisphaerales bacterium]|nr:cytochrome c3 family protein [Phycisphaerae bacterium]NNM26771.1 hypothetical protein [Phycisphaerales bacterium]